MHSALRSFVFVVSALSLAACGIDVAENEVPPATLDEAPLPGTDDDRSANAHETTMVEARNAPLTHHAPGEAEVEEPTQDDPGAKPAGSCTITKDGSGFFTRNSGKSNYVGYVPPSYTGDAPMRLIVGIHGCGDTGYNFATWGIAPYATRSTQTHIAISVDGASGGNSCWSIPGDAPKITAAIEDIKKCFWVHQKKVVLAGYSSGGQLSYRMGLDDASKYAGILISNSGLYAAGAPSATLLGNASWKINVAHRAHSGDSVFPIATVKADWSKMTAAGFPLTTSEVPGTHSGSSSDWTDWLIPQSAGWVAP